MYEFTTEKQRKGNDYSFCYDCNYDYDEDSCHNCTYFKGDVNE